MLNVDMVNVVCGQEAAQPTIAQPNGKVARFTVGVIYPLNIVSTSLATGSQL